MSTEVGAAFITPRPGQGRVFEAGRRVRLGDISPDGKVRFDALARYLQDIARDDSADAEYPDPMAWVVRRTLIEASHFPRFQEWLELSTWCSGFGSRWAERSTEIRGDRGSVVHAVSVWVHVNPGSGMPMKLSDMFHRTWGASAAGRRVSARLVLPQEPSPQSKRLNWTLRVSDLDVMNHMNNAAHWSALVEAAARLGVRGNRTAARSDGIATAGPGAAAALGHPFPGSGAGDAAREPDDSAHESHWRVRGEIEHIAPVSAADQRIRLWAAAKAPFGMTAWLTVDGIAATAARLSRLGMDEL